MKFFTDGGKTNCYSTISWMVESSRYAFTLWPHLIPFLLTMTINVMNHWGFVLLNATLIS